ncbi:helix-turn-helix domain-containing protein [Streptomyces sp. NPDC051453]|uniref:helix-turn-helix domain-containing protein n=1 Tax=Streptomyces sp. NPDC051453 TaxID=3154941 RepID=UPI0034301DCD
MSSNPSSIELGTFLKARRCALSLRAIGLPDGGGRRRVKGLRREEVALLAAISADYYARIEQGRIQASTSVLNRIARVLQLDNDQREHMYELADKGATRPRRCVPQKVHPQLRRLLDDLVNTPAIVLGRRTDILAWNHMATVLITDFAKIPEKRRNYVRLIFTDPAMRTLYANWQHVGHSSVAQLRVEAARDSMDARMSSLVGELSIHDEDFREWWSADHVAVPSAGTKVLRHPIAGELTLHWDTLTCPADPDQRLVTLTAEPGTPAHDGLRFLASWAADQPSSATPNR